MKTFLIAIFIAIAAFASAVDNNPCFDLEGSKDVWLPIKEKCMALFPSGTEARVIKVIGCICKEKGIISEDGTVLDYEKFKVGYEKVKAKDLKEVYVEMDKCYESNHAIGPFLECWEPKLLELCPDAKNWRDGI